MFMANPGEPVYSTSGRQSLELIRLAHREANRRQRTGGASAIPQLQKRQICPFFLLAALMLAINLERACQVIQLKSAREQKQLSEIEIEMEKGGKGRGKGMEGREEKE